MLSERSGWAATPPGRWLTPAARKRPRGPARRACWKSPAPFLSCLLRQRAEPDGEEQRTPISKAQSPPTPLRPRPYGSTPPPPLSAFIGAAVTGLMRRAPLGGGGNGHPDGGHGDEQNPLEATGLNSPKLTLQFLVLRSGLEAPKPTGRCAVASEVSPPLLRWRLAAGSGPGVFRSFLPSLPAPLGALPSFPTETGTEQGRQAQPVESGAGPQPSVGEKRGLGRASEDSVGAGPAQRSRLPSVQTPPLPSSTHVRQHHLQHEEIAGKGDAAVPPGWAAGPQRWRRGCRPASRRPCRVPDIARRCIGYRSGSPGRRLSLPALGGGAGRLASEAQTAGRGQVTGSGAKAAPSAGRSRM